VIDREAKSHVGAPGAIHGTAAAQCPDCEREVDLCRFLKEFGDNRLICWFAIVQPDVRRKGHELDYNHSGDGVLAGRAVTGNRSGEAVCSIGGKNMKNSC
jgi:hypothetical protein